MDALRATYGSDSDESDESPTPSSAASGGGSGGAVAIVEGSNPKKCILLPPPPVDLLQPPNHLLDFPPNAQGARIRSFPHVEGNYALHIFIPVVIPSTVQKQLVLAMKKIASLVPSLYLVDIDIALSDICKDDNKFEQVLSGREFHISVGRTVPIQVHQIDSIVTMLRQKLHSQRRYSIEFNKWDIFVNDDQTRSFLSLEVTGGGLHEISRQIHIVDEIYGLHGLPEFYKNPRPHISLVWALGDISHTLKHAAEEINRFHKGASVSRKPIFMCKFDGIECRIGALLFGICPSRFRAVSESANTSEYPFVSSLLSLDH